MLNYQIKNINKLNIKYYVTCRSHIIIIIIIIKTD